MIKAILFRNLKSVVVLAHPETFAWKLLCVQFLRKKKHDANLSVYDA